MFITHSDEAVAESFASDARAAHAERQIDCLIVPLVAAHAAHPNRCPSLAVVIADGPRPEDDLGRALHLLRAYKADWPEGYAHVQEGLVPAFQAGVVQLVLARRLLDHPLSTQLIDHTCVRHVLEDSTAADLFRLWSEDLTVQNRNRVVLPRGDDPLGRSEIRDRFEALQHWHVHHAAQVPLLYQCLNEFRARLRHDSRKPGLSRPVHDRDLSRLDWLLDEPGYQPPPGPLRTNWVSEGARAVRLAIAELRTVVPELRNPVETKGAQAHFRQFAHDLRLIHVYMTISPHEKFWLD